MNGGTENISFSWQLIESLAQPVFLCNNNMEILKRNSAAESFNNRFQEVLFFHELVNSDDLNRFNALWDQIRKRFDSTQDFFLLLQQNDRYVKVELTFQKISESVDSPCIAIIVNINPADSVNQLPTHISVHTDELEKLISNNQIIKLIDEIRSSYPFTFIGKSKIQQEANRLQELFWIKDNSGIYILVNKPFADALGSRTSQLEGRAEKNYLPMHYVNIYNAMEDYMKDTLHCLILNGIPFLGFHLWRSFQTIEIPLCDAENNVLAIIGIAQRMKRTTAVNVGNMARGSANAILDNLITAYIHCNKNEDILAYSPAAAQLFPKLTKNSDYLSHLFNDESYIRIRNFINSEQNNDFFNLTVQSKKNEQIPLTCTIKRINLSGQTSDEMLLMFERRQSFDSIEDLLKLKGAMYDTLIQYNPEPIFIYDAENLTFLDVNDAALELYGYRREEFIQMDLTDLYSTEDIQTLLESASMNAQVPKYSGPYKHRKKDGSTILVMIAKSAFIYDGKNAHLNVVKNISAETSEQSDLKILRSCFESSSDVILITDATGFIKDVNNSATKILGHPKETFINSSFIEYVNDTSRSRINSSIFFSGIEEPVTLSIELITSDSAIIPAELRAISNTDRMSGNEFFTLVIQPKHIESETPVISSIPEPGTAQVPLSSRPAMDTAQLGTIFHEILTPINVILGFVQELRDSIGAPSAEQSEAIEYITQNRGNLLEIMNTISEYNQIKTSETELKPEELVLEEVIEKIKTNDPELLDSVNKTIEHGKITQGLTVFSDRLKLIQFIETLIKICGHISVEPVLYFSAYQYDDFNFILTVRDDYSKLTEQLAEHFPAFLNSKGQISPKNFSLSRYHFSLTNELLKVFGGKYEMVNRSGRPYELGFILPLNIFEERHISEAPADELQRSTPDIQTERIIDENITAVHAHQTVNANINAAAESEISLPEEVKFSFQSPSQPAVKETVQDEKETSAPEIVFESLKDIELLDTTVSAPTAQIEATAAVPSDGAKTMALSDMHCLYIEDLVDSQILFKVQMKELKEIKFAVSFEEALPIITSQKFDFIVMDINLQGEYNGLDALKMIHQMPGFQNLPIIAVTAYVLPGDKERFIHAGFNDFISKPIFREKIIESLEKIFMKKINTN